MKIPLAPSDEAVAAFPQRDFVIVVTRLGDVFKIREVTSTFPSTYEVVML